jgi:hypothetical protein
MGHTCQYPICFRYDYLYSDVYTTLIMPNMKPFPRPTVGHVFPPPGIAPFPLDPALTLPKGNDRDLRDVTVVQFSAATKTSGSRRKPKAKEGANQSGDLPKRKALADLDSEDVDKPPKRGRPSGAGNYTDDDVTALLDFVEEELPLGQRGWNSVHAKFSKWARQHGRPDRYVKSLETKFKQVCISS